MSGALPDVRYDALLGVTDVFRQRSRHGAVETIWSFTDERCSRRVEMMGPGPLSVWDQSVYLAVIAAVSRSDTVVTADSGSPEGELWTRLHVTDVGFAGEAGTAIVSWRALARLSGVDRPGGKTLVLLRDALERLSAVECWYLQLPVRWASQLIAWAPTVDGVQLALHPHATRVARGILHSDGKPWRYALVSLQERYALADSRQRSKSESNKQVSPAIAQVMHAWLSAWMRRTDERKILLATLAGRLFSDVVNRRSTAARFRGVKLALEAIARLPGWQVEIDGELCRIRRLGDSVVGSDCVDLDVRHCGPDGRAVPENISDFGNLATSGLCSIPYKGGIEPRPRRGRPMRRRRRVASREYTGPVERREFDSGVHRT